MPIAKNDFFLIVLWQLQGLENLGSGGPSWKQKSIQKGVQLRKASWHRFFIDFGGFGEASWDRKSNQDRSKKATKKA